MRNLSERTKQIRDHLSGIIDFSEDEICFIDTAINEIREECPLDIPLLIRKSQKLLSAGDDLSWIINVISRRRTLLKVEIRKLKDPVYTTLARQSKPSAAIIEAEARFGNDNLYKLESDFENIDSLIEYLKYLNSSIERYNWIIKDKLSFVK